MDEIGEEKIKNAIYETYKKYGEEQINYALFTYIKEGITNYFTRENNSRDTISEINQEELVKKIVERYVKEIVAKYEDNKVRNNENDLEKAIWAKYVNCNLNIEKTCNAVIEYINNKIGFIKNRDFKKNLKKYTSDDVLKQIIADYVSIVCKEKENERGKNENTSNIAIYTGNIHALSGLEFAPEGDITLGNMYASSRIGNVRENQEDAVILLVHPNNPNFKMIVVADGMGGHENGEVASNMAIKFMNEWFISLDNKYFFDIKGLQRELSNAINQLNQEIRESNLEGGTTFVSTIVCEKETLVTNIGDSRAYIIKTDGKLEQITTDDSLVAMMVSNETYNDENKDEDADMKIWGEPEQKGIPQQYSKGYKMKPEDMRFHVKSNIITQVLNGNLDMEPHHYIISNEKYVSLFLCSDGVTDCLSDEQIFAISKKHPERGKEFILAIIQAALSEDAINKEELKGNPDYYDRIPAGNDNTTIAGIFTKGEGGKNDR